MRTGEEAHVLDQAQVGDFQRVEHLDGAPHIGRCDVLWGRDDDGSGHRNALGHRQLHVTRPWRQVDDEIVQFAPVDVEQKLPDSARQHRPPPDGRLVGLDEERDRDNFDAVTLDRDDLLVLSVRLLVLGPQKDRHVRAIDVGIEDAGSGPKLRQRQSDVHGAGRFAHAALAGAHRDNIFDPRHLLLLRHAARARNLRVPLDVGLGGARQGRQRRVDIVVDLVLQWTGRRGQDDPHADGVPIDHHHVLDHLELHHRAVKLRILHRGQRLKDSLF